jgi:hypothetical protein
LHMRVSSQRTQALIGDGRDAARCLL